MTVETLGRMVEIYRRTATSRSAVLLVVANAIPLIGVLFFGWSLLTILVVYWVENGIVGFWNVPRIALAQGSVIPSLPELPDAAAFAATGSAERAASLQAAWQITRATQREVAASRPDLGRIPGAGRVGMAMFFIVHYGMFWLVHGIFVFVLPAFGGGDAFGDVSWSAVAIAAVALFLSHGASFLFNYVGRGEYLTRSPARQMFAPYGRVVVLHLTIIFGSIIVAFLRAPIAALLVLVSLKTAFDLSLHLREHRNAGPLPPGLQASNGLPAA